MRDHRRERGRDLLVRPEGDAGHRSSRARASATRKSSAVVTLRLYGESGTTSTGKPARSHSSASSVGAASPFASSAYARSIIARGNPCGVCARHRRSLATVLVIRSCSTSLTVSETGMAATAPTPKRALATTPSIVSRVTNGRAASWTSTTATCGGSPPRPARTDWARVAPPATSPSRSPTSFPSHSGGRASKPAGTTTTTWTTSGWEVNGRSARNSIGTPRMGRNCFGSPGPARTPAPAATTTTPTTPTSGCESPGEVTDAVHADQIEPGQAHPRAGGQEHTAEPLARRLAEASLDGRYRANLAAQADLAQEHGVRRERSVVHARDERRHDGEIGRGLHQAHPARHVHEHVPLAERQTAATLEDGEQHRQAAMVEPRGHPPWCAEAGLRRQRLDLDQERPRPFHQGGHGGAGDTRGAPRQERRGRIRHGLEAGPGHFEHADLVHGAEAVLHGAQDPVVQRALALEVEDRIDDVLERLGAGDAAALRHVPDEQHGGPCFLREAHEPGRALPYLAHVPRRALELVRVGGLDRVDEHDAGAERVRVIGDRFEPRLAQHVHRARVDRQPRRPQPNLIGGLLTGHVQRGNSCLLEPRRALQQQRGLPDTGLSPHQDD